MAIDLKGLSAQELNRLATQIKKQQSALSKRKPIAGVRKKVTALAKAEGYTIAELFAGKVAKARPAKKAAKKAGTKAAKKGAKKVTRKVAPKYRNPANPKETWSGRGRQPLWLAAQVKKGRKAEEFLIKK
jgi:DNA-binding protein H-NS